MTTDVSGFGFRVLLQASETFPNGIELTQFADDNNPFDLPQIVVKETGSGVNGDLVVWSKANPPVINVAMIPNSEDDRNLQILTANNRAARGRRPVQDEITATVAYPDGTTRRFLRGVITAGILGNGVATSGRLQSGSYQFVFEDVQ